MSTISNLEPVKDEGSQSVLLQTCVVHLQFRNICVEANLLYDTGSMRSFISKTLVDKLNLPIIRKESLRVYTFGNRDPKENSFEVVKVTISNKNHPHRKAECELLVTKK